MKTINLILSTVFLSGCGFQVTQEVSVENDDGEMEVVSSEEISLSEAVELFKPSRNWGSFVIGDQSVMRAGSSGQREPDIFVEVKKGWVSKEKLSPEERLNALRDRVRFYELCIDSGVDLERRITESYENTALIEILNELVPAFEVEFEDYDKTKKIESLVIEDARLEHVLQHLDDAAHARFKVVDKKLIVTKE